MTGCNDALLRLLLVELDEPEHILPDESTDGPGAVLRYGDRSIRPDDKAGRVKESALLFVECAKHCRGLHEWKRVADRKADCVLLHCLSRLVQRIRRRGDHRDVLVLQLRSSFLEGSQLLLAVRSPVSTIEQQDTPAVSKAVGKREPPVRDGLHAQRRKQLATIENSRPGSCHHRLPSAAVSSGLAHAP